jgi:hypothetical protein
MTVNEQIHDHSFCYDADLPPSVPEGQPLRASTPQKKRQRPRRLLRRPGRRSQRPAG